MKPLRLLLIGCAMLEARPVVAAPPIPPPDAAATMPAPSTASSGNTRCLTSIPPALYSPAPPGAFGVPSVIPVFVASPGSPGASPEPVANPPVEEAPNAGPCVGALFSPSMFGDLFGRGRIPATYTSSMTGVLNGKTALVIFSPVTANGPPTTTVRGTTTTNVSLSGILGNFTLPLSSSLRGQVATLNQTIVKGTSAPLTQTNRNLINGVLQNQVSFANPTRTTIPGNGTINAGQPVTIAGIIRNDILSIEQKANPGVASIIGGVSLTGAAGTFIPGAGNQLDYPIVISSIVNLPHALNVLTPTGGGIVGQTRISDDNSPLPRDRILFDYDDFGKTTLTPGGFDVQRMSAGFETTFFDRWTSIQVRLPFASTLSTTSTSDGVGDGSRVEVGDVNVTFKGLVYRSPILNVASGLGVDLPTAASNNITFNSVEAVKVSNDAVVLTPFIAWLLTPTENLFLQNWNAMAFNSQGNRVAVNNGLTGLQQVGRLYDQNQLQIDGQVGYWLVHPGSYEAAGLLQGLAPFFELHYDDALGKAGNIRTAGLLINNVNSNFHELDLSVGAVVQLWDRVNFSAGATLPLLGSSSRTFDYAVGVRCNIFFGPTYRARTLAASTSSF